MNELRLVSEGKSDYTIVIAPNAAEPERFAAFELQKYISLISGVKVLIKEDAVSEKSILVGTRFISVTDLGEDGFIMKTEKERLILGGNTPRATLFSVYTFLEKYLGCGWCMPGDDTVPENKTIVISEIDDVEKPAFSYRGIISYPYKAERAVKEIDWMAKNRMNWSHVAFSDYKEGFLWGEENSREIFIPELKKRCLAFQFGGHTSFMWIPPNQYFESHPEYYSFLKGERTAYQLCVSNPNVVSVAAENIKQFIKENPEVDVVDLWIEDINYWCDCVDCQSMEEKQHSLFWNICTADERDNFLKSGFPRTGDLYRRSKSYLTFVNNVAKEVAKVYPEVMLNYLAYSNLSSVPEDVSPAENVLIGFAPLRRKWSGPINSRDILANKVFSSVIEKWAKRTKNLYIYAYYGVNVVQMGISPFIQEDIRYYYKLGIDKISSESVHWYEPNWFSVNLYVYAKLIWNPEAKWQELVEDFCSRYYGKAAFPMTNQWMRIQGEVDWKKHSVECLTDIQEAKSLADNEKILARIQVVEDTWKKAMQRENK